MHTISILVLAATSLAQQLSPGELNDRGLAATEKHDYDAACRLYLQAIEQWERKGPQYALHVAIVKTNLAQAYGGQGKRADSVALMEETLPVFRKMLGMRDLTTLTTLNTLGGLQLMVGNTARAEALFREALPIERELYPNDMQLARTLGGLASIHLRDNHPELALPLAEEALQMVLKADGENSADAALAYANIAEAHRVMGHRDRAAPLYRKSRALYERVLGPEHPRVSSVMTQEGLLLMMDGKLGMAEDLLDRALAIVNRSCPGCAFERAAAENNLALLRIRQGKLVEADRLLSDVLSLQERAPDLPKTEMAVTLQSLAVVRQREKRFEEAARLKRRAAVLQAYR